MHIHKSSVLAFSLLVTAGVLNGCALFEGACIDTPYSGALGDGRTVTLVREAHQNLLCRDERHNYSELRLEVMKADSVIYTIPLARRTGPGSERVAFPSGEIDGRSDTEGRRIWLIEKDTRHIVATYDFVTCTGTGPQQEAPNWADPAGGKPLLPAQSHEGQVPSESGQ